ncbi:hypothetical protein GGG16DRAFT_62473 [Schizophyllum commune]
MTHSERASRLGRDAPSDRCKLCSLHRRTRTHPKPVYTESPQRGVSSPSDTETESAYTSGRRTRRAERARRRARPRRRETEDSYASTSRGRSQSPSRHAGTFGAYTGGSPTGDLPPPPSVFIPPAPLPVPSLPVPSPHYQTAESVAYSTGAPFSAVSPLPSPVATPLPPLPPVIPPYSYPQAPVPTPQYPSAQYARPPPPASQHYGVTPSGPYAPPGYEVQHFQTTSTKFGDNVLGVLYTFLTYRLPLFVYQIFLFRMPVFYYGRVSRVLEDAEMSLADVRKLAMTTASEWKAKDKKEKSSKEEMLSRLDHMTSWNVSPQYASQVTPAMRRFRDSWETFIDSLLREWKTQNVISALLLSALLTMLQIDVAADDVVTRTACILALIAALMSLLYGCLYIIRFGTMKRMHKASAWADEAQKRREAILWNVSIILFIVSIMSYVWRTGSVSDPDARTTSKEAALGTRIGITCILGLGVLYLAAMAKTFSRYGDQMDKAWKRQMSSMVAQILPDGTAVNAYGQPSTSQPLRPSQVSQQYPIIPATTPYASSVAYPSHWQTPYSVPPAIPPYSPTTPLRYEPYDRESRTYGSEADVRHYPAYSPATSYTPSTTRTSTDTVRSGRSSTTTRRRPRRRSSYSEAEEEASPPPRQRPASPESTTQTASKTPSEPHGKSSRRPNVRLGYPAQTIPEQQPIIPQAPSPLHSMTPTNWPHPLPYLGPNFSQYIPSVPLPPQQMHWPQQGPSIVFQAPSQAPTVVSYPSQRTHSTEAGYEISPVDRRSRSRSQSALSHRERPMPPPIIHSQPLVSSEWESKVEALHENPVKAAFARKLTRRGPFSGFRPRQVVDLDTNERLVDSDRDRELFDTIFYERCIEYHDHDAFTSSVIHAYASASRSRSPRERSAGTSHRGRPRSRSQADSDAVFDELQRWNEHFFRQRGMSAVLAYITRHNAADGYAVYLVDMPNTLLADEESIKTLFGDSIPMTYAEGVVIYLYDSRPPSAFRERIQADVVIDIERLQGSPSRQRWTSSPISTSRPMPLPESAPPRSPTSRSDPSSGSSRRTSPYRPHQLSTIDEGSSSRRNTAQSESETPAIPMSWSDSPEGSASARVQSAKHPVDATVRR